MNLLGSIWNSIHTLWGKGRSGKAAIGCAGIFIFCVVCSVCGQIYALTPGYAEGATATTQARAVQATARAIETENAQIIATLTVTYLESLFTPTKLPNAIVEKTAPPPTPATAQTTIQASTQTPTIYYIVVTGVPSPTPLVTRRPATRVPTRAPTLIPPTITPRPANCDPSYPEFCLPLSTADTLNCSDIPYTGFIVLPPDPHDFDHDKNGIGCESTNR